MLRERWGPANIQRRSSHVINSQFRWGLWSKNSRPGELTASNAHDLAPKEKRDSVHYGGTSCIPSPPNGSRLRWRHLTEISRFACWTMMVSSIRSHLRVIRTGPIGSTLGVRGTSISSRPIGATGVNSTKQGSVGRPTDAPWNAVSAFANCGRAVAHVPGSYASDNGHYCAGLFWLVSSGVITTGVLSTHCLGSCQRDVPRSRFVFSGSVEAVGRHRT